MRSAFKLFLLVTVLLLASRGVQAKTPDGWPFVEYNEAVRLARSAHKPMFVYFGFQTCPYCEIANKNTFSSDVLRKRYTEHYVLAYFDIRGNPADVITLPDGEKLTRGDAIKRLKSAPVPAWMFVSPGGKELLMRGNPADEITLPDGEKLTRADAVKRLRSAPVPAWMFVSPEGKEILMRRGSRTPVEAFMQFDQYVSSNAYQRASFENYLAQRGLHEARPPE